jgi:hypothetical protein
MLTSKKVKVIQSKKLEIFKFLLRIPMVDRRNHIAISMQDRPKPKRYGIHGKSVIRTH